MNATQTLRVAEVTSASSLAGASELYRRVFGYTKPEATLNPRLLLAMAANGGCMVGAWDDDETMVGFGYGFTGCSQDQTYFYSQAVVVSDGLQGTGVGRRLKYEQRRLALAKGLHHMRWAYNPILARNAHFNLAVIGAVGRWFAPNCYGDGESRLIVDWDLDAPSPAHPVQGWQRCYPADEWGWADRRGDIAQVPLPAERSLADDVTVRRLDESLASLMSDGMVARNCRRQDERTAVYVFERCPR
ncbi:hypothetical protein SAMN05443377_12130 [Propionibacterium cyclohexanicum]|uniref:N-acetyltransferase domain-containing protein n=1 Tax=Propionibacterium cyclohexanicum TaxID=64702 RepID=A0A1H9TCT8_9ACTN|nr:hypothetical protein [Propionibacterium cyclohexanicum]SER95032.1 hypothetical protein SAMN05443377_12130 [Propionibacterium cyclohexanicum]